MSLVIEQATPEHGDILAKLHAQCLRPAWSAKDFRALFKAGARGLIARKNGMPCGLALYRLAADEGEILTIGVLPSRRKEGLGRALVVAMQSTARIGGAARLFLEVRRDNAPAHGLYKACGFTSLGVRKAYYADAEDAIVYQCRVLEDPES